MGGGTGPVYGDAELSPEVLQAAAATFGMLAATVRLHIVWLLAHGERDVTSLAEQAGTTVQVVSQHLAKLRQTGLVQARRQGRHQVYLINDPDLEAVVRQMVAHLRDPVSGRGIRRGAGA